MISHQVEVDRGERFRFGENWASFLRVLDEGRIVEAERSLCNMLGVASLEGKTFLDVGSGSGLFSLAAHRLGAVVHSFDFDPMSVETTRELRRRLGHNSGPWRIEAGSALDTNFLGRLGVFDVVYAWGVLHHTGDMWRAMHNAATLVCPEGHLFVALYNDQGLVSRFWRALKRTYCSSFAGRVTVLAVFIPVFFVAGLVTDVVNVRNPIWRYKEYRRKRGMSLLHDWKDWLGGYPYETAKPQDVIDFYEARGFTLSRQVLRGTLGCNEFVFQRLQ